MTEPPTPNGVFALERSLPLTDGVVAIDRLGLDDEKVMLANPPSSSDLFWPVEVESAVLRPWLQGATGARNLSLLLAIRTGEELVGGIEARVLTSEIGTLDFWVFPVHRGHGYATRAVSLVRGALHQACDLETVQMRVRVGNTASLTVAKHLGFVEIERHGDEILFHG